ncbi:MAG: ribose 5-phosphate isomerase B [Planctomycetota bacterium]|nr:ribose 5-phosphate isomerase B [Planctomycetota bacterium]
MTQDEAVHRNYRIAIASDHAAVPERQALIDYLRAEGHEVSDFGSEPGEAVDYPDQAALVSRAVVSGEADRGILICGTGLGVCMAANKVDGIRAATVHDTFTAEMARRHNDANVACMGARVHAAAAICRMADVFLDSPFDGGRHAGRVDKIMALEQDAPVSS